MDINENLLELSEKVLIKHEAAGADRALLTAIRDIVQSKCYDKIGSIKAILQIPEEDEGIKGTKEGGDNGKG